MQPLIPVSVVTGFLGSGKTTLISRLIRDPAFGRTAVIINEFGEVGLDHDLIASSDDEIVTLTTGCLCCAVQTDLAQTLMELFDRRKAGAIDYERVLIETSGLSDPLPMLQSMMTDKDVAVTHRRPLVVTLVDVVHGETALLEYHEARQQVALADRILISKTDIQPASDRLLSELDALNPVAARGTTGESQLADFFAAPSVEARVLGPARQVGHAGIETYTLIRDRPMPALALTMLLQVLAEHCGSRLLRIKGLVMIAEMPERPMVIHGVGHVIAAPEFQERWPSGDRRTRIVFIMKGVPMHFIPRVLDALEAEVQDASNPR